MKNYFFNLKRSITILTIVVLLISANVFLNASGDHDKTIKDVLEEIRKELNLSETQKIDPGKVPDQLLEELGDAVMSEQHPNERVHEWMDNMMGGEGSESLKSAHISMGYNYLSENRGFWGGMPMMGGRGIMWNGYGGMMNGFGMGGIFMGIILLIILGVIIYFLVIVFKRNTTSNGKVSETALDILKKRYARGEITKEEFEEKKKDLL